MLPADGDLSGVALALSPGGARLEVRDAGDLVATVDTRTFAVGEPGRERAAKPAPTAAGGDGFPWAPLLVGAVVAGGCALLLARRRRAAIGSSV